MKERKTIDIWEVQGNYGYGWDFLCYEDTKKEAIAQVKCYNEIRIPHRWIRRRISKIK